MTYWWVKMRLCESLAMDSVAVEPDSGASCGPLKRETAKTTHGEQGEVSVFQVAQIAEIAVADRY